MDLTVVFCDIDDFCREFTPGVASRAAAHAITPAQSPGGLGPERDHDDSGDVPPLRGAPQLQGLLHATRVPPKDSPESSSATVATSPKSSSSP